MTEPTSARAIAGDATTRGAPLPWSEARRRLVGAQTYWLVTVTPDGRPQTRPVLGVWVDEALHTTSNAGARKARNLAEDDRCSVSFAAEGVDVVLEGTAATVSDDGRLRRVADAYREKYGWSPAVVDGAFDAPYGAPTAGPPPYHVYEVTASVVFGFGTDDEHAPRSTRWGF